MKSLDWLSIVFVCLCATLAGTQEVNCIPEQYPIFFGSEDPQVYQQLSCFDLNRANGDGLIGGSTSATDPKMAFQTVGNNQKDPSNTIFMINLNKNGRINWHNSFYDDSDGISLHEITNCQYSSDQSYVAIVTDQFRILLLDPSSGSLQKSYKHKTVSTFSTQTNLLIAQSNQFLVAFINTDSHWEITQIKTDSGEQSSLILGEALSSPEDSSLKGCMPADYKTDLFYLISNIEIDSKYLLRLFSVDLNSLEVTAAYQEEFLSKFDSIIACPINEFTGKAYFLMAAASAMDLQDSGQGSDDIAIESEKNELDLPEKIMQVQEYFLQSVDGALMVLKLQGIAYYSEENARLLLIEVNHLDLGQYHFIIFSPELEDFYLFTPTQNNYSLLPSVSHLKFFDGDLFFFGSSQQFSDDFPDNANLMFLEKFTIHSSVSPSLPGDDYSCWKPHANPSSYYQFVQLGPGIYDLLEIEDLKNSTTQKEDLELTDSIRESVLFPVLCPLQLCYTVDFNFFSTYYNESGTSSSEWIQIEQVTGAFNDSYEVSMSAIDYTFKSADEDTCNDYMNTFTYYSLFEGSLASSTSLVNLSQSQQISVAQTSNDEAGDYAYTIWTVNVFGYSERLEYNFRVVASHEPVQEVLPITASIQSLTSEGLLHVQFDSPIDLVQESLVEAGVTFYLTRIAKNYSIDHTVISLNQTDLFIRVNIILEEDLTYAEKDSLELQIVYLNASLFTSENHTVVSQFTSQFEEVDASHLTIVDSNGETVTGGTGSLITGGSSTAIAIGFTSSQLTGGSMQYMWPMISTMQMIQFMPCINVTLPTVFQSIFRALQVSAFDFLPFDRVFQKFLESDPPSTGYTQNFHDLTYESIKIITNIIDLVCVTVIVLACMLVVLVMNHFFSKDPTVPGRTRLYIMQLADKFRFNYLIVFFKETFLPLNLFALINLVAESYPPSDFFSVWNLILSVGYLALSLAFFTFFLWFILTYHKDFPNDVILQNQFGEIFINKKEGDLLSYLYIEFFLGLRILYILVIVFMQHYPTTSIIIMVTAQSIFLQYLVFQKPFKQKTKNWLNIFNESCVLFVMVCHFFFTPLFQDESAQIKVGWTMVAVISFNVLTNMGLVFYEALAPMVKKCWALRNRRKLGDSTTELHEGDRECANYAKSLPQQNNLMIMSSKEQADMAQKSRQMLTKSAIMNRLRDPEELKVFEIGNEIDAFSNTNTHVYNEHPSNNNLNNLNDVSPKTNWKSRYSVQVGATDQSPPLKLPNAQLANTLKNMQRKSHGENLFTFSPNERNNQNQGDVTSPSPFLSQDWTPTLNVVPADYKAKEVNYDDYR